MQISWEGGLVVIVGFIIITLFAIGIFFTFAGVVGMIRMPDAYCRLQSSTNIATMGVLPIVLGCCIYGFVTGNISIGIKSLILMAFLILTNPIASHALTKMAYKTKAEFCEQTHTDEYGGEINE